MDIRIKHGLNIPIEGKAKGELKTLPLPKLLALDLSPFESLRFNLLKQVGDRVEAGEPLAEDKSCPGRMFVAPGSGVFKEVVRGFKRRILSLVIETDKEQKLYEHEPLSVSSKPAEIMARLMAGGMMPHIADRPCVRIANQDRHPEVIFVKALESAPFMPSAEMQLGGRAQAFTDGLRVLSVLAPIHLIYAKESTFAPFVEAEGVQKHTASGPHPIANPSVHIAALHPLLKNNQTVWSLTASDVAAIGKLVTEGKYETEQVISIAGEGIAEEHRGFFKLNRGYPIRDLIQTQNEKCRYISGDPLTGEKVELDSYLGFYHSVFCALPDGEEKREFIHFLKFWRKGYSATKTYLLDKKRAHFSTLQHGEERAFVDSSLYEKVMPLPIHTIPLIKALLAEDLEKAEQLGLLEVLPEDFALPAFLCPSKIEMPEIIKRGLKAYSKQYYE